MQLATPLNLLLLSLSLSSVSLPCVAQTHYCIAGDLDHLTTTEVAACKTKMSNVRDAVKQRGAPGGWHFVVVCDETGWSDLSSFSGGAGAKLQNVDFHTDRELHWTFLRGSSMHAEGGTAAGMLLTAAMKGIPGRSASPGLGAEPQPMPNPERTIARPSLELAEVQRPDDLTAGQ